MAYQSRTVTIANTATASEAVSQPAGFALCGIGMPAALDGTAIKLNFAGRTITALADGSTDYEVTFGANKYVPLNPQVTAACPSISLIADTQSADRLFELYFIRVAPEGNRGFA